MDLRTLRTFLAVAETQSFTRAGETLGYAQPTVSLHIRQLEEEFSTRLFERINHTVVLTDDGRKLLRYAQSFRMLEEDMHNGMQATEEIQGLVRIVTSNSMCRLILGPRYAQFRARYPGIHLELHVADTREMFEQADHNQADLILTLDNPITHADYIIADEEKMSTSFIAAPDHPLVSRKELRVADLVAEPFLLTEKDMSYRGILDAELASRHLHIDPIVEVGSVEVICQLVEQGMGLSFLPDIVTDAAVKEGRIAVLPVCDLEIIIWKQLLYHRNKWLSPAMKVVMDFFMTGN